MYTCTRNRNAIDCLKEGNSYCQWTMIQAPAEWAAAGIMSWPDTNAFAAFLNSSPGVDPAVAVPGLAYVENADTIFLCPPGGPETPPVLKY